MKIIQPIRNRADGSGSNRPSKESLDSKYESSCASRGNNRKKSALKPLKESFIEPSKDSFRNEAEGHGSSKRPPVEVSVDVRKIEPGQRRRRSQIAHEKGLDNPLAFDVNDVDGDLGLLSESNKEFNRLLASGIRLLSMREHSQKEISDKLNAKTDSPHTVDDVIVTLLERDYLSDQRFIESYIRSRGNRGVGPVKIRAELSVKGITNTLICDYLDIGDAIWFDNAKLQYEKKFGELPLSSYSDWAKRARFLQGRGFTMEHIHTVLTRPEF